MVLKRKSIKQEKIEPEDIPAGPQRRAPNAQYYQSIVGKEQRVRWKMPSTGLPDYDPIKRKPNEKSVFDTKLWPQSRWEPTTQMKKKESQKTFLLNDNDMADLAYVVGERYGPNNKYQDHKYLVSEVERRAWEKYGGPEGFQSAKQKHDLKPPSPRKRRATEVEPAVIPIRRRYAPYPAAYTPSWDFMQHFCTSCACDHDYDDY